MFKITIILDKLIFQKDLLKRNYILKAVSNLQCSLVDNLFNSVIAGGVRGAGLIWSPKLVRPGRISRQMLHISDWLPTLITAAGGDPSNLTIDGMNMWNALSEDTESPRANVLHNIDDLYGVSAITVGDWKLIQGKIISTDRERILRFNDLNLETARSISLISFSSFYSLFLSQYMINIYKYKKIYIMINMYVNIY